MKSFFEQYPNAKSLWQVGDKYFLHGYQANAQAYAYQTDQKVKEVKRPKSKGKVQGEKADIDGTE